MKRYFCHLLMFLAFVASLATTISAQATAFSYQGNLTFSGQPANGNFDFAFTLFAAETGGTQLGTAVLREGVQVLNGNFTVTLDFGSQFPGADRFLEIGVRTAGNPIGFSILSPRRRIESSPYSVRSLSALNAVNATQLGGVAANQFVLTNDSRLSDARQPLPGSSNYIQNSTPQAGQSNFTVSGSGIIGGTLTANVVTANSEFRIGSQPVLRAQRGLSVGVEAGPVNGQFLGNSFFGHSAGRNNDNTTYDNTLIGFEAGTAITSGNANTFVGSRNGSRSVDGSNNTLLGATTGGSLVSGSANTFIGASANFLTSGAVGSQNTLLGFDSGVASGLTRATAIGSLATVTRSESIVLGAIAGVNNATADTNVGIGTTAPTAKLAVAGSGVFNAAGAARFDLFNSTANLGYLQHVGNTGIWQLATTTGTTMMVVNSAGNVGIGTSSPDQKLVVNGIIRVTSLGAAGATSLCRNANSEIASCSSSLRYKKNIVSFAPGMSFIRQLQPIAYEWKADGMKDVGFGAEDIAKIDPRFVTYNDNGEVEGIKYDRLSTAFVNAFTEQQTEIETLKKKLGDQQAELDALKSFICSQTPTAAICRTKKEEK